ncbi:hypothetical protein ABZV31_21855 [Streptomyces sp. NPDC005202]|uniref:hypothetical protein n=1 Tax=Streptomyces sp. NPDC005202 TaxID=3157021 RepID=UPI0033AD3262
MQKAPARQMQYWESFVRHGVPRAEGQPAMAGSAMAGRPGVVLSLNSAAEGGNTLGASVHREHQRHLGDTAGSG